MSHHFCSVRQSKSRHVYRLEHIGECTTDCLIVWTFFFLCSSALRFSILLTDEPVVLKFSTHSSIGFWSWTASFWCTIKCEQKALCHNYRFTSLKKSFNCKHAVCTTPNHDCNWLYLKKKRHYLDRATISTYLSSLALHWWQFKMWEVFLSHPVKIIKANKYIRMRWKVLGLNKKRRIMKHAYHSV